MRNKFTPWTQDYVDFLNTYQHDTRWHPYTCGNNSQHRVLLATVGGWICEDCDYTQNWALDYNPVEE